MGTNCDSRKQFWSVFIVVLCIVIIGSIIEIEKYYNQIPPTKPQPGPTTSSGLTAPPVQTSSPGSTTPPDPTSKSDPTSPSTSTGPTPYQLYQVQQSPHSQPLQE